MGNQSRSDGRDDRMNNEIVTTEKQTVGLAGLGGIQEMQRKMQENLQIRDVIVNFVNASFLPGVDFGPADPRSPKDTLLKPGAEKICHLFNTHPEWRIDHETWKILGEPAGTVCMICEIIDNSTGRVIGEGRGAETVGNKQRDSNKAIKNAEKCSLVDATLYTFMLSERFTQDRVETKNFIDQKKLLVAHVSELRKGCASTLTDNQFIIKVCEREIHKKSITTKHELDIVFSEIENYDYETGEKIPEEIV